MYNNQSQITTTEQNPMDSMQQWLSILAMMKKNKTGFWKEKNKGGGEISPDSGLFARIFGGSLFGGK